MIIKKYFPGYTSGAITFTIDDGNVMLDKKLIDIVRPAGIKGTFNLFLNNPQALTDEEYRTLYSGFEIQNHCNAHPLLFAPDKEYIISDTIFNAETADRQIVYPTSRKGLFKIFNSRYWATIADEDTYLELVDETKVRLEEIFGEGAVRGFVWPYGKQRSESLFKRIAERGYEYMRNGALGEFTLPKDRLNWCYNASYSDLMGAMDRFIDSLVDGELKFFCFGLHSHDFENSRKWDELSLFAEKYGNRPSDFWYATVSEIFDYEDAINSLSVNDREIINPSDLDLYISIDGKEYTVKKKTKIRI